MKHTKGPWKLEDGNEIWNQNTRVATIVTSHPYHEVNSSANARLIAAAPELLEACRRILETLSRKDTIGGVAVKPLADKLCPELSAIEYAIAKATGGSK